MKKNYREKDVLTYLDNLYKKTNDDRLVDKEIQEKIIKLIKNGCKITILSVSDLLSRLDFKPKDLTIEALEAFLAELRSIFWLQDFGFTNITPLKAEKSAKPDFTAKLENKKCAIEVFCLTRAHEQQKDSFIGVYKNVDPQFLDSKFGRDFMSKANNKRKQLDSVNVRIKILLCVINHSPIINCNDFEDMQKHAKFLYDKLSWGNGYYVGLLTGAFVNGKLSDVIYPCVGLN